MQTPTELTYASVRPFGNAALLLRLAVIFTFLSALFDLLGTIVYVGLIFFMRNLGSRISTGTTSTTSAASMPSTFPMTMMLIEYAVFAGLAFVVGITKLIAGIKLHRLRAGAWGWGLAAGIVGCIELWCSLGCVIPLAAGVYTISILSFAHVRAYMLAPPDRRNSFPT